MPSPIEELTAGLSRQTGAKVPDLYPAMFNVALNQPDQVGTMLRVVMKQFPRGGTFYNDAISYLPAGDFQALVAEVLETLNRGERTEAANSFIAYCSQQSPQSLHPHLDGILKLRPNGDTYYSAWPWRESGKSHLETLSALAGSSDNDQAFALEAMFETRDPEVMNAALKIYSQAGQPANDCDPDLLRVGFELREERFHQLFSAPVWHLVFDLDYLRANKQPLHLQKQHPTWNLADLSAPVLRFGGQGRHTCSVCGGRGHHLLTIDKPPKELGVSGSGPLVLETCLSCLGWEEGILFYRHDDNGVPSPVSTTVEKRKPKFPAVPLKETSVRLVGTPLRWRWQDWALSNSRENLHRLGGHPCWIQDADYLRCPDCHQTMQFLLQLDSDLPTSNGKEFLWGSGGICYGFWCDACRVSGFYWQCT